MSIVDTPEKYLSNVDRKYDMRKIRTSSVKLSSTLFSCSMLRGYNRVNNSQKKYLMLKSYLPGTKTLIFPKTNYDNIFSKNLVNE